MMKNFVLCFLVISGCYLPYSRAENAKTQDTTIRDYQKIESVLLDYLRKAIAFQESKLHTIKARRRHLVGKYVLKLNPYQYASDPILQFKVSKRFTNEWKEVQAIVRHDPIAALDKNYRDRIANFTFPTMEDLRGAVTDYLDFQRTRNIPTKDLADGDYPGAKRKIPLKSADCHAIASYNLYDPEKIPIALDWLKEAQARFKEKRDFRDLKRQLTFDLAFALSESGQHQKAADLAEKMVWSVDYNEFQYVDMHSYFKAKAENRKISDIKSHTFKNDSTLEMPLFPPARNDYLTKICNRQYTLTPSYAAKLKCRYTTNNNHPLYILSPLKEEELYLKPKVSIYRQFLSDYEVDRIINESHRKMANSGVRTSPSKSGHKTIFRLSKTHFIPDRSLGLNYLLKRTDQLLGLSGETAEQLQVTYYDAGGFYTSHYDAFPHDYEMANGNRIATVLYYLNDGSAGGETAFYNLNIAVEPEKGSALVWDNLKRNGLVNQYSGHGACPVLQGHKWIATRWYHFRGQIFYRPCTLNKDE